jgi:nucleotide-binding universal stress UspA family protein
MLDEPLSEGATMNEDQRGAVVVGISSEIEGAPELDWAAREAAIRGRSLHIVRALDPKSWRQVWDGAPPDRDLVDEVRRHLDEDVGRAVRYARSRWPELLVWGEVVDGVAWDVLRAASTTAELTVVGSRRLNALGCAVLGSVSTVVAAGAAGPVVVVGTPTGATAAPGEVVVGVDGGHDSEAVLSFAFDYASRHRRPLRAVYCWSPDLLASMQWRVSPPPPARAERWLAEAVSGWADKYPDVVRNQVVRRGHVITSLVEQSEGQDLLVVGSHNRHARVASLLGSVSQGVLHHARCPVAVVHEQRSS